MKISIVIPVYGTEAYFDRCMKSVMRQSLRETQIIVVNDGSPGDIRRRVKRYQKEDPRIQFLDSDRNEGLLRARLRGAAAAKGEYIAFLDSDDYVSMDFYRSLYKEAERSDADLVIGKTVWEEQGRRYVYNLHQASLREGMRSHKSRKSPRSPGQIFFAQEASCYSWHTIWNKIYRKSLWDSCTDDFQLLDEHIVMTEDLFFSSILFYKARTMSMVENDAYFYCKNQNGATDQSSCRPESFEKSIKDIAAVFCKLEYFLRNHEADADRMQHFFRGKAHYARMWNHLAAAFSTEAEQDRAKQFVKMFFQETSDADEKDYFFESIRTEWKGALEYQKEEIAFGREPWISFDIFDTLVVRPFEQPRDLWKLMDQFYMKRAEGDAVFSVFRKDSERMARERAALDGQEDTDLEKIYQTMEELYDLDHKICRSMMLREKELEIKFCQERKSGRELFELALETGKKIVLVSDMYLDRETLVSVLEKCGYGGWEDIFVSSECGKLKSTGSLFHHLLKEKKLRNYEILHIGDSWENDVQGSKKVGIRSLFFPKAMEMMKNHISGYSANDCSYLGEKAAKNLMNVHEWERTPGPGCMRAMAANLYFDNPYREFLDCSDYNADPFFLGYFPVGMQMLGMCSWMNRLLDERKGKLWILGRDGYLVKECLSVFRKGEATKDEIGFLAASRKMLLPYMVKKKEDFYQLPIEYRNHTPASLREVLTFCRKDQGETEQEKLLDLYKSNLDQPFESKEEFYKFIRIFLENEYSEHEHEKNKKLLRGYYACIREEDLLMDMGYSGRIHSAVCNAAGKKPTAVYIHEDYDSSVRLSAVHDFDIVTFFPYRPRVSGPIREVLLSDTGGSWIGLRKKRKKILPQREVWPRDYVSDFAVRIVQAGAIAMVTDYMELFCDFQRETAFSPIEVSMQLEGFFRRAKAEDLRIFHVTEFEDFVFGAQRDLCMERYWLYSEQLMDEEDGRADYSETESRASLENNPRIYLNNYRKERRALLILLSDPELFKRKLKKNVDKLLRKNG